MRFLLFFLILALGTCLSIIAQKDTINIFTIKGCMRCGQTLDFVKSNEIPYRHFQNEVQSDHEKLVKVMYEAKFKDGNKLEFPVVVLGKTNFNIPNLETFLETLKTQK